jgi:hypothetical protein
LSTLQKAKVLHLFSSGALVPSLLYRYELPPHRWGRGIASSERLASGGDHLSTNSGGHLCTNNSPVVVTTSARTPMRKGPRPRLPTGGDNEAIQAKELEARRQVALMVSPAKATTSAEGSLTSGSDHLSTDDSGHLRTSAVPANGSRPSVRKEVLAPVLTAGVRTRPSKNADAAPAAYDVLYRPPVRPPVREKPWMWRTYARHDRRPCGGRAATPRPDGRRQRRRWRRGHPSWGTRHTADGGTRSWPVPRTRSSPPPRGW